MEWSKFIITIIGLYIAYYALNFLYDLLNSNRKVNKDEVIPLTFEDDTQVKDVDDFDSPSVEESKPVTVQNKPLTDEGVINEEVLITNDRKEEYFTPTGQPVVMNSDTVISPTGAIEVLAKNIVSGGLSYKEVLKKAAQGSIIRSSSINFGEEAY